MEEFLNSTEVIDWHHPDVLQLAQRLAAPTQMATAKRCFEWVRDEIRHSLDFRLNPVTCSASEVLQAGTGYCYAKSHLLAALLRANSIPAGLCYQRLSISGDGPPFCLHGLNAAFLPDLGWYRIDARGNKTNVNAQFSPPTEQLAFPITLAGEQNLPEIHSDPLPQVLLALRIHKSYDTLAANLPDIN